MAGMSVLIIYGLPAGVQAIRAKGGCILSLASTRNRRINGLFRGTTNSMDGLQKALNLPVIYVYLQHSSPASAYEVARPYIHSINPPTKCEGEDTC